MEEKRRKRLISYIGKFSGRNVAVVGDLALDWYLFGSISRVNPEMPHAPVLKALKKDVYVLGCAGNVAANLATLGAKVSLYGILGKEKEGNSVNLNHFFNRKIHYQIKKLGIRGRFYHERDTLVKQRVKEIHHNGYVTRVDHGEQSLAPLSEDAKRSLMRRLTSNRDLEAIVLSDYNKTMFREGFSQEIIQWAISRGIPVFSDPKPANFEYFKLSTVIRPNETEARNMTGMQSEEDIKDVLQTLRRRTSSKYVIITKGKEGMIIGHEKGVMDVRTKARGVVDVVGAGDTVISVITLGIISGADVLDAALLGNYAAGIVVEKPGTATLTRKELAERISSED